VTAFSDYYRRELRLLREVASDFAQDHPSLAGLLKDPSPDPDVERILEGVAFLSGDIRRKLDDEFPEILHGLIQTICPQHLRPIPSSTVIAFEPKVNLKQTLRVPAGTHMDSTPVQGEACRFRTCFDVEVAPLQLVAANRPDLERELVGSDSVQIRLTFEAAGVALSAIKLERLRLHLAGDFAEAADLYALLNGYLRGATLEGGDGRIVHRLGADAVQPVGFGAGEALLPRPGNVLPAFGMLQDYFLLPDKYLFVDLDLSEWADRGDGSRFSITFDCKVPPFPIPRVMRERFVLHATPAVNLFIQEAEPLVLDFRELEMLIQPTGAPVSNMQIFAVERVTGIGQGATGKRDFEPFSTFAAGTRDKPVYQAALRPAIHGDGADVYLSVAFPPGEALSDREILKVMLTCTNGRLPESLMPGDIAVPTRDTPELVTFRNLTVPSPSRLPPLGKEALWHVISHLSLNYLSVVEADNLRAMLRHYIAPAGHERGQDMANGRRIDAIAGVLTTPEEYLLKGVFVRGQRIRLKVRSSHFAGEGDKYLFGNVLNHFFASCAALNTFTALEFEDSSTGDTISWPPRIGTQPLL